MCVERCRFATWCLQCNAAWMLHGVCFGEEAGAPRNLVLFPTSLCGVLVLILYPAASSSSSSSSSAASSSHTIFLSHTTFLHTIFNTQLCRQPSFTHNFVTHHLSHTTLSHSILNTQFCYQPSLSRTILPTIFHTQLCHTQLCHTPSFTHNFVTHHPKHTTLLPTIFHTQLCHTPSFTQLCHAAS